MKITALYRNNANQIIAEVVNCGKTLKMFAFSLEGLVDNIYKACHFTDRQEIRLDLITNYSDFQ